MDPEKTAIPGSDPGNDEGKVSESLADDDKGQKAADTPPAEEEVDDDGKPLPFDKHPKWIAARQAEKRLQELMRANEVEDIDDLVELVESGKKVIGKIDPEELDVIIEKASTLERYQEYWDRQKEQELLEGETPEETAERLSKENAKLKAEKARQKAMEDNQKAIQGFNTLVAEGIKAALPDIPPAQSKFLAEFLGVDNPAVEVEITNKSAVSKVVKDGVKKFEKFKQQIIKDYLDGKEKIPDVKPLDTGGVPKTGEVKTLKDARKTFLNMFR